MGSKSKRRPPIITNLRTPYGPWQAAFAPDALRRAWLVVQANRGGKGIDGQTVEQFASKQEEYLAQLSKRLQNGRYQPQPVKQILVPKANANWRPLSLWTIQDRIAQRATYNYLEPVFERQFLSCSFGFRHGRSTADAAEAIAAARQAGAHWVLDADIKDCFGQMQNSIVLKQLERWRVPGPVRQLIRLWLYAKIGNAWHPDQAYAGTSQGSSLSPLLCNMYLHSFDRALQKPGLTLVRYADDFVVLAKREVTIKWARSWVKTNLRRVGLKLHPHKTKITNFEDGFQFVGWFFVREEQFRLK